MAQQSRAFVRKFAVEYMRLIGQIKQIGNAQDLGHSHIDTLLNAVTKGEEAPIPMPPPPTIRRIAAAAGAPGQQAVDDAPPARATTTPMGSAQTEPEPTMALAVHCTPKASEPAVPAPHHLFSTSFVSVVEKRLGYADVVSF